MGLSTASQMARRTSRQVVLFDNHTASKLRSSSGQTRGLQYAYSGLHANLLQSSTTMWNAWNEENQVPLIQTVGHLSVGTPDELKNLHTTYSESKCTIHSIPSEMLSAHYPYIRTDLPKDNHGLYEASAKLIDVPETMRYLTKRALRDGVKIMYEASITDIDRSLHQITVNHTHFYEYETLVLCSGPWTNQLLHLASLELLPLFVSCEQVHYLPILDNVHIQCKHVPITAATLHTSEHGFSDQESFVYVVPEFAESDGPNVLKVGVHQQGPFMNTESFRMPSLPTVDALPLHSYSRRTLLETFPTPQPIDLYMKSLAQTFLHRYLNTDVVDAPNMRVERCYYTTSIDQTFVVGPHADDPNVYICTGFNGEGFKFAPIVGKVLTELVLATTSEPEIELAANAWSPSRWACTKTEPSSSVVTSIHQMFTGLNEALQLHNTDAVMAYFVKECSQIIIESATPFKHLRFKSSVYLFNGDRQTFEHAAYEHSSHVRMRAFWDAEFQSQSQGNRFSMKWIPDKVWCSENLVQVRCRLVCITDTYRTITDAYTVTLTLTLPDVRICAMRVHK